MTKKPAKVAIEGVRDECELLEVVCGTAVVLLKGNRTMTGTENLTALNKEARELLGIPEPEKKAQPEKKPAAKKSTKAPAKKKTTTKKTAAKK